MESSETTAGNAVQNLADNGAITQEEANNVNEELLEENLEMTEVSSNSMLMKVGGVDLLIDFMSNLTGAGDEIAMIINGIEVTTEVAANPESMQGLVASLVSSQLEGKEVLGLPLMDLVNMGIGLITGDTDKSDFSSLFGTLIRGALNMFVGSSPIGAIIGALAGPLLDGVLGGNNSNQNSGQNNNNNNNSGGSAIGNIVNTIGGALGGGNSNNSGNGLLGGIFNLITNLFK